MRDGVGEGKRYRPAALLVYSSKLYPQSVSQSAFGKPGLSLRLRGLLGWRLNKSILWFLQFN